MILHNTKENGVAENKANQKNYEQRTVTMFPIVYHVMSHKIASISGEFVIERHIMFFITILQKISTTKDTTGIAGLLEENAEPKIIESHQQCFPSCGTKLREEHVNIFV
jgi:hypothetical protein